MMTLKHRLTAKITRQRLRAFLEQHRSDLLALEVGAKEKPYRDLFPNTISGDIAVYPSLDAQFDAHALPFAAGSFTLVVCTEVLEHCHDPHRAVDEFHRVLKPGGKLILTTRFVYPIHDAPHDYFRFTKYGLRHLCRDFATVQVMDDTSTVETLAVLYQRLVRQANWRLPLTKAFLSLLARFIMRTNWLLKAEYGDASRTRPETNIMASGYYVVAIK